MLPTSDTTTPSIATPQTACSGEVSNQTLMNVMDNLQIQMTSVSIQQEKIMEQLRAVQSELKARTEPIALANFATEPGSPAIPKGPDSAASGPAFPSGQVAGSIAVPPTNTLARSSLTSGRPIRRQNAFIHQSNTESPPWTAPGGYYPYNCGTHLTFSGPTHDNLSIQPSPNPHVHPQRREGAIYCVPWPPQGSFVVPGPAFQSPHYPPMTAPTTPTIKISSPKHKREDTGDTMDGDKTPDRKRNRRLPADDIDEL